MLLDRISLQNIRAHNEEMVKIFKHRRTAEKNMKTLAERYVFPVDEAQPPKDVISGAMFEQKLDTGLLDFSSDEVEETEEISHLAVNELRLALFAYLAEKVRRRNAVPYEIGVLKRLTRLLILEEAIDPAVLHGVWGCTYKPRKYPKNADFLTDRGAFVKRSEIGTTYNALRCPAMPGWLNKYLREGKT